MQGCGGEGDCAVTEQGQALDTDPLNQEEGGNGAGQGTAVEQREDRGHLIDVGTEAGGNRLDQHAKLSGETGHHEVGQEAYRREGESVFHY
ncbi:hypothetical protein [Aeromonas schubertii]|uniref:hypothetical protein n=1 Tax=Aeromonas schubertii TaxID=652 RepID=UPI0019108E12|nr:hypothetical protein [Aeromonas schubertii]